MRLMRALLLGIGLITLLSLAIVACDSDTDISAGVTAKYQDLTDVDSEGNTSIDPGALDGVLGDLPTDTLSADEAAGLVFMREEEKLARDVYADLYDRWAINIFQNIANSEQTHTDAVKTLLDRYGLDDPAADSQPGVFQEPLLQDLYDQLVAQGSLSLADALKVGAAIEEIDLLDLEERLAKTDKADIVIVYENLMKGSRNHLRSFTATLSRQTGESYEPQYLDQDVYDAIVNAQMESGGR